MQWGPRQPQPRTFPGLDRRAPRQVGEGNCPSLSGRDLGTAGAPETFAHVERQPAPPQDQPLSHSTSLSLLSSRGFGSLWSFLFLLTACSGVQPHPPCLRRHAARPVRRRLRRHPPPSLGPPPPLTSDLVSADPQLDINSRSPKSQPVHPSGPKQERGAPPRGSGALQVRSPGAAPGCDGAREAAVKIPAAAAARRARGVHSSPAVPLHPQKPRCEQLALPCVGGDTAAFAALSVGAARAGGAAGGSAAAAALCCFSGRSSWEHEMGRADAAAGAEVLPGNPNETPRQPAPGVA